MELDAVADELYGLPPGDFTAARDRRAREARAAGQRELAGRIHRLRRPTLAAWASNLLVRRQPDEARLLLELGEALRRAHRDLDGAQLRELSARQHHVTAQLARQATRLAAEEGQRVSDAAQREVAETLHAALADPDAGKEWAAGRLARPLAAPVGFGTGTPAPTATPASAPPEKEPRPGKEPRPEKKPRPGKGHRPGEEPVPERQREQRERRDRGEREERERKQRERGRQEREQRERARARVREAERALRAGEKERDEARSEAARAEERQHRSEEHVAELEERLRQAKDGRREARTAVREATTRLRRAEREAETARTRLQDAEADAGQRTEDRPSPPRRRSR